MKEAKKFKTAELLKKNKKRTAKQLIKTWPKWKQNLCMLWRPNPEKEGK